MKFFILTFGCRSNQADSAAIRESFLRHGMTECETPAEADLIIVNTCTVTHRSDQQARQAIRRVRYGNTAARVVVTGCYAQRDAESLAVIPGVRMVVGNAEKLRIPELLETGKKSLKGQIVRPELNILENAAREFPLPEAMHTGGKTRPLVKLQDGCDARCAYCVVPKVRGTARSARPEDVLRGIQSLIDHGFQEIVLTGINLGAYGRQIKGHMRFIELLKQIAVLPGLGRVRLSSMEPAFFDREIVDMAAENPVIARHFHLPLQSGSDRVLRLMRRPYTAARFRKLIEFIHKKLPDAGLGTDVLVGFPGETEQDFEETRRLLEELPLSWLHVFPFSPREGTEAFSMPDQTPSQILKERAIRVNELARFKNMAFRRRFIGQVLPAITLAKEEKSGESVVLTHNYIHARVSDLTVPPNRLVSVRIREVLPESTYAVLVDDLSAP